MWVYERVELGEGGGIVSGPCSNWNHLPKAGRGHGSAQLALFPGRGSLAKWGKKAASLWGTGWSSASGHTPPRLHPLEKPGLNFWIQPFTSILCLLLGLGLLPWGDSGGALTVAN